MKARLLTVAQGFCIGAADVVPGVSGGTMAFILGIYERLLEAIRAFDWKLVGELTRGRIRDAVRHTDLWFLIALGIGIFSALMFFTRVVPLPKLIHTHPVPIYSLFFGLIIASVVVLARSLERLTALDLAWVAAGVGLGWAVVNLVPVETPEDTWFIVLSGAIAICAMILPGISGSFILLILKKYAYVFDAIGRLDAAVIVPFFVGAALGLMAFSRVLVWMLHHYHQRTLLTITGLLIGSLWVIWPFQNRTYEIIREKSRLVSSEPVWPASTDPSS